MLAYFDSGLEAQALEMGRYHPWTTTMNTEGGRYVDFKSEPDTILATLEDLRGLEDTVIARSVVDLLRWANSADQPYETNDFGLRPIKPNGSPDCSPHPLELTGRVTFLFRDLRLNCHRGMIELFKREVLSELKRTDPEFMDGCIAVSRWPHLFTELQASGSPAEGLCTTLTFGRGVRTRRRPMPRPTERSRTSGRRCWPSGRGSSPERKNSQGAEAPANGI